MPASNEYTERHLTPDGWVRGSTRVDPGNITEKEPPSDRVLTVRWTETGNGWGPFSGQESTIWRSTDTLAVDQLLEKYGKAPTSL